MLLPPTSPLSPAQPWYRSVAAALSNDPIATAHSVYWWLSQPTTTAELTKLPIERKTDSGLMRFIGLFSPGFMQSYWSTFPWGIIYAPSVYDEDVDWGGNAWRRRHAEELTHEMRHLRQIDGLKSILFMLTYVGVAPLLAMSTLVALPFSLHAALALFGAALTMLPASTGLAIGRWRIEGEAYLVNIIATEDGQRETEVERIVNVLWDGYGWTWPKPWMRRWFGRALATIRELERGAE